MIRKPEFWDKIHMNCAEYSDNMMHAVIELDREIDFERLRSAFVRALGVNPVLHSAIRREGNRFYYEELPAESCADAAELFEHGESQDEFAAKPFDTAHSQARAGVFRADGKDTLVVMMNRIAADTVWLNFFAEELIKAYSNESYEVKAVPERNFKKFFGKFTFRERYTIFKLKPYTLPKNVKFAHFPTSKLDDDKFSSIVKRTVPAETMDNVRLYSKHIGVSLDDILIAAYVRSIKEHVDADRAINIDCAIDLRNYFAGEQPELFTNYISHTNCNIGYDIGDELVDTIFKVNLALQHTRNTFPGLDGLRRLFLLSHLSNGVAQKIKATKRYTRSALLFINNGEIKAKNIGAAAIIGAYTVNSIKQSRFAELNLSSYGLRAVIALPIFGNHEDMETAGNILDNMIGQLDALKVISQYK